MPKLFISFAPMQEEMPEQLNHANGEIFDI